MLAGSDPPHSIMQSRGGGNWKTLRIPFGKIGVHLREDERGITTPETESYHTYFQRCLRQTVSFIGRVNHTEFPLVGNFRTTTAH